MPGSDNEDEDDARSDDTITHSTSKRMTSTLTEHGRRHLDGPVEVVSLCSPDASQSRQRATTESFVRKGANSRTVSAPVTTYTTSQAGSTASHFTLHVTLNPPSLRVFRSSALGDTTRTDDFTENLDRAFISQTEASFVQGLEATKFRLCVDHMRAKARRKQLRQECTSTSLPSTALPSPTHRSTPIPASTGETSPNPTNSSVMPHTPSGSRSRVGSGRSTRLTHLLDGFTLPPVSIIERDQISRPIAAGPSLPLDEAEKAFVQSLIDGSAASKMDHTRLSAKEKDLLISTIWPQALKHYNTRSREEWKRCVTDHVRGIAESVRLEVDAMSGRRFRGPYLPEFKIVVDDEDDDDGGEPCTITAEGDGTGPEHATRPSLSTRTNADGLPLPPLPQHR
ncbi:hypothetical protein IAU59_001773 [Kwoniella sp. CBS 9459]